MKRSYLLLAMFLAVGQLIYAPVAAGDVAAPAALQPADVAAPKLGPDGQLDAHFKKDHEEFLKRRTEGKIGVLFLGDSITEGWHWWGKEVWPKYYPQMDAANFGIGGDKTQHVLWRIDNGELDGIDPKVLVLLIGTNNIADTAENILNADEKIVAEIHEKLPQTKVLVLGIFPRGANPKDPNVAEMRTKIKTVNQGLAKLDDGDKTRFLDISDKFLGADGTISPDVMKDYLHPTAAGYEIWADAMNPLLNEMLK
jgi:lysophospholipase L1-like esterase